MSARTLLTVALAHTARAAVVEYDFTIHYFTAAPDGVAVNILGINGVFPAPLINVTQGDTLVVRVQNNDPVHAHDKGVTLRDLSLIHI